MPTDKQTYAFRLYQQLGSKTEVARQMGVSEGAVRKLIKRYYANLENGDVGEDEVDETEFSTSQIPEPIFIPPPHTGVASYILCAAQSQTKLSTNFWNNLRAYADHLDAQIFVATFNYDKSGFGLKGNKASLNTEKNDRSEREFYPSEIRDFIVNQPIHIGNDLIFCGEMNTLPTAVSPLSGFETYTREKWGVFPHAKIQLKSIATAADKPAKQIMTTGSITAPNYIMKRAGIRAHFHHQTAAVILQVASDGSMWCRHLIARDDDEHFYDLDVLVKDGVITTGHRAFAVNWGDIHIEKLDWNVARASWGESYVNGAYADLEDPNSVVGKLKPEHQFIHDLVDFEARNHHNINDPHFIFQTYQENKASVESNVAAAAEFLSNIAPTADKIHVVKSNHDNALIKWLKNPSYDFRVDPENAVFYLETQLAYYKAIKERTTATFYEDTLYKLWPYPANVDFIHEDQSFVAHGIEFGMHGHLGANGGKGSARTFTKMGMKSNTGHTHSPEIFDGAYIAGVSATMDMGYNKGLSSWAHAHIVTYQNGTRTIITAAKNGLFFPPTSANVTSNT